MATVVAQMPARRLVQGKWDQFLDGQVWRLVKGEDYTHEESVRVIFCRKAKRAGLRGHCCIRRSEPGVAYVQAVSREGRKS